MWCGAMIRAMVKREVLPAADYWYQVSGTMPWYRKPFFFVWWCWHIGGRL